MPGSIAIRNASIVNGTGAPAFPGDVLVSDGHIEQVGSISAPVSRDIDARGLSLSPGFVDTHSHDDGAFIRHPGMHFKLAQGVTSEISGNCGFSAAPNRPGERLPVGGGIVGSQSSWEDLEGYFRACEAANPAINNAMLVGHNTVRWLAMGMERGAPTADQLAAMRGMVASAMEQGAVGFSTGLIYEPGRYSQTDEVVVLCSEAGAAGGLYATHMRNEGDRLLDAVREAMHIAREARTPLHISHHKSAGRRNWGRIKESFEVVENEADGVDVTWDIYPYIAGSGPMAQYFRLDAVDEELARNTRIANCPAFREFEGKMIPEIADKLDLPLEDTVRRIITAPRGTETICIQFTMDEGDVVTNLRHPRVMIGSDGIPDLDGKPHPRLYGTFPRVLGKYVRDEGVIPLEEAVRRMTSLACDRFGLASRGRIEPGHHADLVLFDPATVGDLATWDDPQLEPAGIELVMVNGEIAIERGQHTGAGSGRMLRAARK